MALSLLAKLCPMFDLNLTTMKKLLFLSFVAFTLLSACTMDGADNPANSAESPENTGPDNPSNPAGGTTPVSTPTPNLDTAATDTVIP